MTVAGNIAFATAAAALLPPGAATFVLAVMVVSIALRAAA